MAMTLAHASRQKEVNLLLDEAKFLGIRLHRPRPRGCNEAEGSKPGGARVETAAAGKVATKAEAVRHDDSKSWLSCFQPLGLMAVLPVPQLIRGASPVQRMKVLGPTKVPRVGWLLEK